MDSMIRRYFIYLAALLSVVAGCDGGVEIDMPDVSGHEIEASLNISAEPMPSGTPLSKAGFIDQSEESVEVRDLWVLQFDGTDESSKLLKACYYPEYSSATKVRLLTSTVENTIIIVANTGDPAAGLGRCRTLGSAADVGKTVIDDTSAHGGKTEGKWDVIMNGKTSATITDSMGPLSVSLKRNAVRVDVTVINSTGSTANPVTVSSVAVCSGVQRLYYYTDFDLPEIYPSKVNEPPYIYPATDWADGTGTGDSRRFTFYVPANMRGKTVNSDPSRKPALAPSNSTYLLLLGTDSESRKVVYRFYLGADMMQDYNLIPGYRYSYEINLTSSGDCFSDSRVENLYMQDYTAAPLANSYMVHPPTVEGVWKNVRVPVRRIHDFWNTNNGYEKVASNALETGSFGWRAEIVLSTVELVEDVNFKWIKRIGDDYTDYFEFAIPAGLEGNFVVGVHRFTDAARTLLDDVFLWSWHFWLTAYDPDASLRFLTPETDGSGNETRFAYPVKEGQVNRFLGNVWNSNSGVLKGCFMMDRNLGALSTTEARGPGSLYYMWGRKDPFPYSSANWHAIKNGVVIYNRYNSENMIPYRTQNQLANIGITEDFIRYSVYHPEIYIAISSNWSLNDVDSDGAAYNNAGNWFDTKLGNDLTAKSIFDPCPPGWRVAPNNCFATPSGTVTVANSYTQTRTLPNGVVITFPCQSYYSAAVWSNSVQFPGECTSFSPPWSNQRSNVNNAFYSTGGSSGTGTGRPVRCVSYAE